MATNFPSSLDTFTNPSATDTLDSPPHDQQHANINDAVEALEAKVGVNSSAVTSSLDYRVTTLEGAGAGMETSATPPASPSDGDLWYDTDDGRTYVYYDDGTSQQWVEFGAPAVAHGKILQVVSTTKTDTFSASVAVGAVTDVTGLSATITPSSASSKILVTASVHGGNNQLNVYGGLTVVLKRASTQISIGDAASTRFRSTAANLPIQTTNNLSISNVAFNYLDSPNTTSATTYQIEIANSFVAGATATVYVNRSSADTDFNYVTRPTSTITVMEVAA